MVTETEIRRSISRVWIYAKSIGIGQIFSDPTPLRASDEFKEIARNPSSRYEEVYLCGLSAGQYNMLLEDYSYLQFGGHDENSLRYAYYPNPFLSASAEAISEITELKTYAEEGVIDIDEFLHRIAELRYTQHPPLVRYENSDQQYKADLTHPSSHFHFGHHSSNRWPVRRILTPEAFALIIFKYFYSDDWHGKTVCGGAEKILMDDALITAKQDCRILSRDLFSERAEKQFSFG